MARTLTEILLRHGHLNDAQLETVAAEVTGGDIELGEALLDRGLVDGSTLLAARSEQLGVPTVEIDPFKIDPEIIEVVPEELARRWTVVPLFHVGDNITLAMADPSDVLAIDEVREETGCDIIPVLALRRDIVQAISIYHNVDSTLETLTERALMTDAVTEAKVDDGALSLESTTDDDSPLVGIVNLVLLQAIRSRASDIHIEPDEDGTRVRYRVNGTLGERYSLPLSLHAALVSRIKVLADLDLAQKRLPQDGRIAVKAERRRVDLRISTLPTIKGEKVVIRLLDKSASLINLDGLGMGAKRTDTWRRIVNQPNGLVLVTGPTGSGKSTTLYSSLGEINTLERNIVTVEDPVEFDLPVVNQVQVLNKAGLNFAAALRSILRQDPDVVMVGEIRDAETASIAVRAALTGHLVLSTLHTNDAASAPSRLIDMGIEPYLLASALKGVLAQRLVRRTCPHCGRPAELDPNHYPDDLLERIRREGIVPMEGKGCRVCSQTGFVGRTTICELLEIDDELEGAIVRRMPGLTLRTMARSKGMLELFEDGLEKVASGITGLNELMLATRASEEAAGPVTAGAGTVPEVADAPL